MLLLGWLVSPEPPRPKALSFTALSPSVKGALHGMDTCDFLTCSALKN
jgi:hypothetical protein